MGAGNVKAVFALWPELPYAAFRALTYMALTSKDDDEPARFWAGREALAFGLGIMLPPSTLRDAESIRVRRAAFARVDRATFELAEAGAIKLVAGGYRGQNATYELNLTGGRKTRGKAERAQKRRASQVVDNQPIGVESTMHGVYQSPTDDSPSHEERSTVSVTKVCAERDERSTLSVTMHHAQRGPEEVEEEIRTELRSEIADVDADLAVARARPPRPIETKSLPKKCAHGLHNRIRKDGTYSCRFCRTEAAIGETDA